MEPTKQLFDKPPDELREAFVRARFAQEDVFGKPDIEDWLAEQRTGARSPVRTWCDLVQRNRLRFETPFDVTHLESLADRSTIRVLRDLGVDERGNVDACYTLIGGLDERYADVYAVAPDLHLVVRKRRGTPYEAIAITADLRDALKNPSPSYTIRPATDADFLRAVVILGLNPTSRRSRMRERARQLLCNALEREIAEQRAKAEADFDSAVAVSADGTKIVHADWVVVADWSSGDCRLIIFPSSVFQARKCLRPDDRAFARTARSREDAWDGATFVRRWWGSHGKHLTHDIAAALLLEGMRSGTSQRFYITTRSLCSSPLPDGGVEVTV
ncbi:hypothetical protein HY635_04395 [Candidatus Uhrbacteria bacterium]|nr:hypothetical protein [Candidatus Uhrbacteria bacterium]